jgi:hypothetical protein
LTRRPEPGSVPQILTGKALLVDRLWSEREEDR